MTFPFRYFQLGLKPKCLPTISLYFPDSYFKHYQMEKALK